MDWILHLDTDELIHPAGAGEYSLRQLLRDIPSDVDMVVFPNYVCYATYLMDLMYDNHFVILIRFQCVYGVKLNWKI